MKISRANMEFLEAEAANSGATREEIADAIITDARLAAEELAQQLIEKRSGK